MEPHRVCVKRIHFIINILICKAESSILLLIFNVIRPKTSCIRNDAKDEPELMLQNEVFCSENAYLVLKVR